MPYPAEPFAGSSRGHCGPPALAMATTWMIPPSVIIPRNANKLTKPKQQLSGTATTSNKSRFMVSVSGLPPHGILAGLVVRTTPSKKFRNCRASQPACKGRSTRYFDPAAQRPRRSLPKGKHLLLVGRVAVRLNEIAGPDGQLLPIAPRHALHLGRCCDMSRTQPSSTLSATTRTGRLYCPFRRLRTMVEASASHGSVST
jgi:hypothetical protein